MGGREVHRMDATKILITGGLGFIGRHLANELAEEGRTVRILDNLSAQVHGDLPVIEGDLLAASGIEVMRGDVSRREDVERALQGVDGIVHLAAETGTGQSMYEIARYARVNTYGTAVLLDVLANCKHEVKKVVLSSSRSVYGEGQYVCGAHGVRVPRSRGIAELRAGDFELRCPECAAIVRPVPTSETAQPQPASVYAATKLAQEELVRICCTAAGIPFTILRFQNVYGPGQSLKNPYTGILSIFSTKIRRKLVVPVFEDGTESRDFVHVEDVARALRLALDCSGATGKTLNVGSGQPTSIRSVAEMLIRSLRGTSPIEITGQFRLGDIRHCWADLTEIRAATGFEPQVTLEQGLAKFADWVEQQPLPEDRLAQANGELRSRGLLA